MVSTRISVLACYKQDIKSPVVLRTLEAKLQIPGSHGLQLVFRAEVLMEPSRPKLLALLPEKLSNRCGSATLLSTIE